MNVYDFDGTIYNGDSSIDFFKYCLKINKKCYIIFPKLAIVIILYLLKVYEKEKLKSCFFSIVRYFDNIEEVVNNFWEHKNYELKTFYLKQKKDTDIIISASPEFLLKPVAEKYNFKLIATIISKDTGEVIDKNCYGNEKIKRLKKEGVKKINIFYSDSLSDLPLCKISKNSFLVKGDNIIKWDDYEESTFQKIKKTFFKRDFITFVAIGIINAFNGIWIAYVYSLFIKNPILAYIFGFFTSLMISYILNSLLNFKSKLSLEKFTKFSINNIPNFVIQVLSVTVIINIIGMPKLVAYSISAIIAVPITFLLVKNNVFKEREIINEKN